MVFPLPVFLLEFDIGGPEVLSLDRKWVVGLELELVEDEAVLLEPEIL